MSEYKASREITLTDILLAFRRHHRLFLIIFLIGGTILSLIYLTFVPTKSTIKAVVHLNFKGIESRKNLDGTLFLKEQIITPEIQRMARNATYSKFQQTNPKHISAVTNNVEVSSVIPMSIREKQEKDKDIAFVPSKFMLQLTLENASEEDERIASFYLEQIIREYKANYMRNYGLKLGFSPQFPEKMFESYELIEIAKILEQNITSMYEAVWAKSEKASETRDIDRFISPNSLLSLFDLKGRLKVLGEIKLARAKALASHQLILQNPEEYEMILSERLVLIGLELGKARQNAKVTANLLDLLATATEQNPNERQKNIDHTKREASNSLMLDSSAIDKLRKDTYLNLLISKHLEYEERANSLEMEIKEIQHRQSSIGKTSRSLKADGALQINSQKKEFMTLNEKMHDIQKELLLIFQQTKTLFEEYNIYGFRVNDAIQISQEASTNRNNVKIEVSLAISSLTSGVIAGIAVLLAEILRNYSHHRRSHPLTKPISSPG